VFAAGLLAWLLKKLIETVGLRPVDRVLGAGFGLLRGAIMLLALALVVNMTPCNNKKAGRRRPGRAGSTAACTCSKAPCRKTSRATFPEKF